MKSISIHLILILVACLGVNAQKPILVTEDSLSFGKNVMPAVSVIIPEANYEKALKAWKKDLESGTKSKLVTENSEMSIFGARLKEINPDPVNVYSKMMNLDSIAKLTVAIELKKDLYVGRSAGEEGLTKFKNYVREFAKNQYIDVVKDQVDAEEKKLRDIQKELSSLEKDKTNLQKVIQSNNTDIVTEKGNIEVQNNEVARLSAEIVDQNKQLSSLEAGDAQNLKKDQIKDLEKMKKKALNSIESSQNKIDKANNEIDKANLEIPKNDRMQQDVMVKIERQQIVCQQFADKLKTIKAY
ncbi:MAG TPA: hypothetical protein PLR88_09480 [Bacteroidales bacterium]|nr:hypothetical protein [Bacteroidales bacterium]